MRSLLQSGTCTKSQNASDIIGTRLQGAEDSSITADHSAYKQGQNCFGMLSIVDPCLNVSARTISLRFQLWLQVVDVTRLEPRPGRLLRFWVLRWQGNDKLMTRTWRFTKLNQRLLKTNVDQCLVERCRITLSCFVPGSVGTHHDPRDINRNQAGVLLLDLLLQSVAICCNLLQPNEGKDTTLAAPLTWLRAFVVSWHSYIAQSAQLARLQNVRSHLASNMY